MTRRCRLGDIEHFEAAAEIRIFAAYRIDLAIDQHDAVVDTDLVRQRAFGDFDFGNLAWVRRVAHIDKRGAVRGLYVPDVGDIVADHDLSAAGTIEISDDL